MVNADACLFLALTWESRKGAIVRYAMKSTTPQQATWRTSDRSPWWLRSTRYNEPNGDYSANCFMDLWRTPHNSENNIQFNDWRCNYRSRSYYCQPEATTTTTTAAPVYPRIPTPLPPIPRDGNEFVLSPPFLYPRFLTLPYTIPKCDLLDLD